MGHIIDKIKKITIPNTDAKDKLTWKFTTHGEYSVKKATWGNNDSVCPNLKATIINSIWKLNLISKLETFA